MGSGSERGFGHWVGVVLDLPADQVETADTFWSQALGWSVGPAWPKHPEFHHLEPPQGHSHLLVQTITGPPRVHLDLYADDIDEAADRIAAQGATQGERLAHWQVMTSPTGFPFCVVHDEGERDRPEPKTWPGGHRSSLRQVCLDVPHGQLGRETTFWRQVTGWAFEPSDAPEFAGHLRPTRGGSIQLLVQELGPEDDATTTRAHIDLGSDDREAVAEQLESFGARRVRTGRGWIVMRDPTGMRFCVTGQAP